MEMISAKAARAKGLKYYYTGKPCKHGHVSERYVGTGPKLNGGCMECRRLSHRIANMTPAKIKRQNQRNRIESMTPEQIKRRNLRNLGRNRKANMTPEQIERRNQHSRIESMTPEQIKRQNQRNRIRSTGFTPELFDYAYHKQNGRCAVCRIKLDRTKPHGVHADHDHDTKTPRGLLCTPCNRFEGWLKRRGLDPEVWGKRTNILRRQSPVKDLTGLL